MKKLLTIAAVLLTAALVFTGCSNPSSGSGGSTPDKGTAPVLEAAFWTDNTAWGTGYETTDDFPNRNSELKNSTQLEDGTWDPNADYPFRFLISFTDPDKDVIKLERSWKSDFSTLLTPYEITQKYEDQLSSWSDVHWFNVTKKNQTLYVRLLDQNGNKSNVISIPMTFTNVNN